MKTVTIDIVEREPDGEISLGAIEVDAKQLTRAMRLIEDKWGEFQGSIPSVDSEYIEWLIARYPKVFLREGNMNQQVFVG